MRELEFLKVIQNTLADSSLIGDDCAYLEEFDICVTQDTLVEGVHFLTHTTTPFKLGQKAVNVNLSDLAAAGARPLYITVSLSLPRASDENFVQAFYQGVQDSCQKYGVNVAGGDLTGADNYFISICAIGKKYNNVKVSRSFAQKGDIILTTGTHGDSAAGLALLQNGINKPKNLINKPKNLINKHLVPLPAIEQSEYIMQTLKDAGIEKLAMMDTSDGLQDAIFKLSKASNLEFDIETIPAGIDLKTTFPENWKDYALWGGEDFELIFTIPPCLYKYFNNPQFIKIGTVSDRPFSNALEKEFEQNSFKHFEE